MSTIRYVAMPTEIAEAYRAGAPDANGQAPERYISDGSGVPCRHCLGEVAAGEPYLLLAHRPFPAAQPYAELGPVFLHAEACERYPAAGGIPPMLFDRRRVILRGYGADHRIVDGTGQVVAVEAIPEVAAALFARPGVACVHVRSATNNCFICRIERAEQGRRAA